MAPIAKVMEVLSPRLLPSLGVFSCRIKSERPPPLTVLTPSPLPCSRILLFLAPGILESELESIRKSCPFSCRESYKSVKDLCDNHVQIKAPTRNVKGSCGGQNFAYPAARAGHTMTAIGPSALVCGGFSPVITFEADMKIKCVDSDKVCSQYCEIVVHIVLESECKVSSCILEFDVPRR